MWEESITGRKKVDWTFFESQIMTKLLLCQRAQYDQNTYSNLGKCRLVSLFVLLPPLINIIPGILETKFSEILDF